MRARVFFFPPMQLLIEQDDTMLGEITNTYGPHVTNHGGKMMGAVRRCAQLVVGANHHAPGVAGEVDLLGGKAPPSGIPEPLKPDPAQSPPAAKVVRAPRTRTAHPHRAPPACRTA